jgi:hypothetical protein
VLWQNGEFSYYPARIGAAVVSAYVAKQRRLANNLVPPKTPAPIQMSAVWTNPSAAGGNKQGSPDGVQAGNFLIQNGKIVAQAKPGGIARKPANPNAGQTPTSAPPAQSKPLPSKPRQTPAAPAKQEDASLPTSRKGE